MPCRKNERSNYEISWRQQNEPEQYCTWLPHAPSQEWNDVVYYHEQAVFCGPALNHSFRHLPWKRRKTRGCSQKTTSFCSVKREPSRHPNGTAPQNVSAYVSVMRLFLNVVLLNFKVNLFDTSWWWRQQQQQHLCKMTDRTTTLFVKKKSERPRFMYFVDQTTHE